MRYDIYGSWNIVRRSIGDVKELKGIEWACGSRKYFIPVERLGELETVDGMLVYYWLWHMAEKTWLDGGSLRDLNELVKALLEQYNGAPIDSVLWKRSLDAQRQRWREIRKSEPEMDED